MSLGEAEDEQVLGQAARGDYQTPWTKAGFGCRFFFCFSVQVLKLYFFKKYLGKLFKGLYGSLTANSLRNIRIN